MANTAVIEIILSMTREYLVYMLPIIAVLSGITFIFTMLFSLTIGLGRRTFRG